MRNLIFEGDTWQRYEKIREKNKVLHRSLRRVIKEMLRKTHPEMSEKEIRSEKQISGAFLGGTNKISGALL